MNKQIKLVITVSQYEEKLIADAYARQILNGATERTMSTWAKRVILDATKDSTTSSTRQRDCN